MAAALTTSFKDAADHFTARSAGASDLLSRWESDARYRERVVPFVKNFVASALYRSTPEAIEAVCEKTEHALGEVKRRDAESVEEIVNWNPAFALQHTLHYAAETLAAVPTFQDFRAFVSKNDQARAMLLTPSQKVVDEAARSGASRAIAMDAMKWRVGNAYLAFLKESYMVSVLRASGFDARYHLLADVLFRVDAWVDDKCVSIFVVNPEFRGPQGGRKPAPSLLLGGSRLKHVDLPIPARHVFGTVHLPDREALAQVAKSLL
jgi:hypothetical protein